jgi:hypothetical protein
MLRNLYNRACTHCKMYRIKNRFEWTLMLQTMTSTKSSSVHPNAVENNAAKVKISTIMMEKDRVTLMRVTTANLNELRVSNSQSLRLRLACKRNQHLA